MLIDFCQIAEAQMPAESYFARLGGEEFAALVTGDSAQVQRVCEAIRVVLFVIGLTFTLLAMVNERSQVAHRLASLRDPLTGTWNRRALFEQADNVLRRRVRISSAAGFSAVLFDYTAAFITLLWRARSMLKVTFWPAQTLLWIHLGFHLARIFLDDAVASRLPGAIGGSGFSIYVILESNLPVALGNVIVMLAYGTLLCAFRTFCKRPAGLLWPGGALLWALLCLLPDFYHSQPLRVLVLCLLCIQTPTAMMLDIYTLFVCELYVLGFLSIIMIFAWVGAQYDRVLGFTTLTLILTLCAVFLSSLRSAGLQSRASRPVFYAYPLPPALLKLLFPARFAL
ncbi:hypothetical protein CRX72_20195 [Pantoea sp. BRM17]|nr:hypothetical protein CRX72_20195 [Pantoea sp. BRM17]